MSVIDELLAGPTTAQAYDGPWNCPEHGEYAIADRYGHRFPTCKGCEKVLEQARRAQDAEWYRYRWWQSSSGIPARYCNKPLSEWRRETAGNRVIGAALDHYAANLIEKANAGDGLVLLGPPGLGKTHILTAIVAEGCRLGLQPHYAVWPDILVKVKGRFGRKLCQGESDDALVPYKHPQLLALDEVALKAASTEFEAGLLFDLIDHRYRERRCTIIASNATKATLASAVGDRAADRLRECATTLVLTGESKRGQPESAGKPQLDEPKPRAVPMHHRGEWREKTITEGY